jgi:hypothetical protein
MLVSGSKSPLRIGLKKSQFITSLGCEDKCISYVVEFSEATTPTDKQAERPAALLLVLFKNYCWQYTATKGCTFFTPPRCGAPSVCGSVPIKAASRSRLMR